MTHYIMLPIGESRSVRQPYAKVEGFDYTHLAKYEIDEAITDEGTKRHLKWLRKNPSWPANPMLDQARRFIDGGRILTATRTFEDSACNLGLQLADIVATTLCRGLNGNLQPTGWSQIALLLIRKKTAPFVQLGKAAAGQHPPLDPLAAKVWRTLDANSQAMVLETEVGGDLA